MLVQGICSVKLHIVFPAVAKWRAARIELDHVIED
jgi:hypothetical protein